jgi:hypothetical protein
VVGKGMKGIDHYLLLKGGEIGIATRAHEFRLKLGIADQTYVEIIDILEFRVVEFIPDFKLMVRRDIELEALAVTTFDPPRIYVRETVYDAACNGDPDCRQILAHELGHLLLHEKVTMGRMQENTEGHIEQFRGLNLLESTEKQADVFARHFLIPPYVAFPNRTDAHLLARYTGTSKQLAAAAITISKRVEMLKLREQRVR